MKNDTVIWIDITHPAQLNFYKNSILKLSQDYQIIVTIIKRGKLPKIAEKELSNVNNLIIKYVGKHKGTKFSAILDANIFRILGLVKIFLQYRPSIAIGNGILHPIVGRIFNIPVVTFDDDIERSITYKIKKRFSTELYYAKGSERKQSGVKTFNSLKEWSYLSPNYFLPNSSVLKKYSLKPFDYIFVREVITGTLNYNGQTQNIIGEVSKDFSDKVKVLLSLEDKTQKEKFPKNWILLEEPIEDIHSLVYYSRIVISSGDSMAREGAMLGSQSIYCGIREMNANNILIEKNMLFHVSQDKIIEQVEILSNQFSIQIKDEFRESLKNEWEDTTNFIINRVKNNLK